MLIVTRKEKESIILELAGEMVEITVTEIGRQVRLGITAPQSCKILRKELYATIAENKEAAGESNASDLRERLRQMTQPPKA